MEFGLKGTSRLVADVTGSRHSGLGFTVFWLFMAVYVYLKTRRHCLPERARGGEAQQMTFFKYMDIIL